MIVISADSLVVQKSPEKQMERLSYFMHNPAISDEIIYAPLLKQFIKEWTGQELILVMETSMF